MAEGPFSIRPATARDVPLLVAIENACFESQVRYSTRQLRYLVTRAHGFALVETEGDTVRGFIIVLLRKGSFVAGVETLNVVPECRGQGSAARLLRAAEEELVQRGIGTLRLEVSVGNRAAIAVYERIGFVPDRVILNYYRFDHYGSKDALRMVKHLCLAPST
jgi:ribosomal protein S18 acetylase RimI-like enzyme